MLDRLQSVAEKVKQLNDQTQTLPKDSIELLFEFLAELNKSEIVNTNLYAFLGQTHNAMSVKESSIASKQFKKVLHDIYKQEHQPWWKKALDAIVKVVMPVSLLVVGVVTMQPELIVGVVVATALIQSGAIKDLGESITKGLEEIGVPDDAAEMIGGVLAVATAVIVSLGAGALISLESEAVEVGGEMVQKLAVNTKSMVSVGLMGGSMGLATEAPEIVNGFVDMLPVSDDVKKTLKIVLTAIVELIAAVGLVIGGGMTMSASGSEDAENVLGSFFKKLTGKVGGFISERLPEAMDFLADNSEKITKVARYTGYAAGGTGGGAQIGISVYQGEQAKIQKDLGYLHANLTQLLGGEKWNEEATAQETQDLKTLLNQYATMISEAGNLSIAQDAVAVYLAQ